MPYQVHKGPFLQWHCIQTWECSQTLMKCMLLLMPVLNYKKKALVYFRYYEVHREVFTRHCRGVQAIKKLLSTRVEWKWNRAYQKLQEDTSPLIKTNACMKFYNKKATISWNKHVKCWIKSRSSASEDWNVTPKKWGSWQNSTVLYGIYQ